MEDDNISPSNHRSPKSKVSLQATLETDWDESIGKPTNSIKKNSLDSDEEDDGGDKKYDILDDDEIEGQEEGTGGIEGEIQITPFNMKEELEEGHFDTEGNYFWKKEKLLRDNWLENIDWVQVKEPTTSEQKEESDSDDDSGIFSTFDHIPVYKKMLEIMKPGETVAKTLRRLGGNKTLSASERWKRKKAGEPLEDSSNQQVTEFTELANRLLYKMGNMDIYQEKYEEISLKVQSLGKKSAPLHAATSAIADEHVLDMFGEDFDNQEKQRQEEGQKRSTGIELGESSKTNSSITAQKRKAEDQEEENAPFKHVKNDPVNDVPVSSQSEVESTKSQSSANKPNLEDSEVCWEFKWEKGSTEIHGPHTSAEMQNWVEQGYFKEVWVRKCGTEGEFYTSKRIDFEIYI